LTVQLLQRYSDCFQAFSVPSILVQKHSPFTEVLF